MINEEDYSVDGISIYSEEAEAFHERLNNLREKYKMKTIHDKLIDIILKVAMAHHDDISKSDEDAACDAADEILKIFPQIPLWLYFTICFAGFAMGTGMILFLLKKF